MGANMKICENMPKKFPARYTREKNGGDKNDLGRGKEVIFLSPLIAYECAEIFMQYKKDMKYFCRIFAEA